jgi:hypothetical protein
LVETAATLAVKVALVAATATVTDAGTVALAWLLDRATVAPPAGAAALRVTVQLDVPAPVKDAGEHVRPPDTTEVRMVTELPKPAAWIESPSSEELNESEI